jgi:hypothetical protein
MSLTVSFLSLLPSVLIAEEGIFKITGKSDIYYRLRRFTGNALLLVVLPRENKTFIVEQNF